MPSPVAALARRAGNAKSAKDRHDTAYFAWEVSLRLCVAARPPADYSALAKGSLGHWAAAASPGEDLLDERPLLDVYARLTEVGTGQRSTPQTVTAAMLFRALPAYRNQVIGHGSARSAAFYSAAADALLPALPVAWDCGVFLPRGASLVYADSVELDADGTRRARLLELSGDASRVLDSHGTRGIPEDMLPRRVYLMTEGDYRSLHPWVLFREDGLREDVFLFNGLGRRAAYLDYATGNTLKGDSLEGAFPGAEAAAFGLFSGARGADEKAVATDPNVVGDYRILGKLGEGGMGVVYLARQQSLGRFVALKMLPVDGVENPTSVARFRREIGALSRCEHPNVVKILSSGAARDTQYYAMEYVEGADLRQILNVLAQTGDFELAVSTASERIRAERAEVFSDLPAVAQTGPVTAPASPTRRARQVAVALRDAARGIQHLHENGIVHRDVKPANLMITSPDRRIVVMDLGLAAMNDASREITGDKSKVLGTLRYMPPEQLQRSLLDLDHRADIYALGATFYEVLTRRPLFEADSEVRLIEQILRREPIPAHKVDQSIPGDLSTIVRKATMKDPDLRYDSAGDLALDVDNFIEQRPISARGPSALYMARMWAGRNRPLMATVLAASLVIAAVGAALVWSQQKQEELTRRLDEMALLSGNREPRTPSDHLLLAHTAVAKGGAETAEIAEHFVVALDDAATLADLNSDMLYVAVQYAAQASVAAAGSDGARLRHRGLRWLEEYLGRQGAQLAAAEAAGADEATLRRERAQIRARVDRARTGDRELEGLRGSELFAPLFEGMPH